MTRITHSFSRAALVVIALTGCPEKPELVAATPTPTPAPPASAPTPSVARPKEQVLAGVDAARAFEYFATAGGNHPTLFLNRPAKELVVVGRERSLGGSTHRLSRFPAGKPAEALAAYHRQLIQVGYLPHEAPPQPPVDPNGLVAVPMEDLFGSPGEKRSFGFSAEESEVLYKTSPLAAWTVLSGRSHPTNDFPAIAAGGPGLYVCGRGVEQKFSWDRSREAFAAYEKLVAAPAAK